MNEYSKREMDEWRRGRNRRREDPPDLSRADKKTFLELCSRDESSGAFEFKLGLGRREIQYYRGQLGVVTVEDARELLRHMVMEDEADHQKFIAAQQQEAREAREAAEARLDQMEREKRERAELARQERLAAIASKDFKTDDAERQKRFDQQKAERPATKWRLPIKTRDGEQEKKLFWNDITGRGMRFCREKYGVTDADIRSEAFRLGLSVNWEMVRP